MVYCLKQLTAANILYTWLKQWEPQRKASDSIPGTVHILFYQNLCFLKKGKETQLPAEHVHMFGVKNVFLSQKHEVGLIKKT